MKLYIDTTNSDTITIGLDGEMFNTDSRQKKAQLILPFIDEVLRKNGKDIKDVDQIEVNTGPGSFTGIRVGVSVAQTIAWHLNIPINGKILSKTEKIDITYS
jgi:tRNA threonylcarbamoyladenosine biosynthesis protein TsaB